MLSMWWSASSRRRPGKKGCEPSTSIFSFFSDMFLRKTFFKLSSNYSICTLFNQQICLYSVEPLILPPSFFQLLLVVCQPSFFLPHCPLVILVNILQLLIRTLEDLSCKQASALVTPSLHQGEFLGHSLLGGFCGNIHCLCPGHIGNMKNYIKLVALKQK